jgi:hypothetical protein
MLQERASEDRLVWEAEKSALQVTILNPIPHVILQERVPFKPTLHPLPLPPLPYLAPTA